MADPTTPIAPDVAADLDRRRGLGGHGSLPLPRMSPPAPRSGLYCTVTPVDSHGRLADRTPLRAAAWPPGQPITITASPNRRLINVHAGGPDTITRDGRLRLPAHIRRACHLATGDRLLVTVTTAPARLIVYPMTTIETIINQQPHPGMAAGAP